MKKIALITVLVFVLCAAVPALASGPRFRDVDEDTPQGRAIEQMVAKGYIAGDGDLFHPDDPITADDYITMLAKCLGVSSQDYMSYALDAGWYDWDQIPPDNPQSKNDPVSRELGANIIVKAFFGNPGYDWDISKTVTDFDKVSGRYYAGVLGGLTLGIFNHQSGTPFNPLESLSRGDACLWTANADSKEHDTPSPTGRPQPTQAPSTQPTPSAPSVTPVNGGVSKNGWLQVRGTQLCNEAGDPVLLHGMSSMGIQWYPQYTSYQSIQNTVDRGANIFRIAMYTEAGGYLSDKPKFTALVEEIVENARRADVYVIIDWHILSDGNPMDHIDEAATFFDEMSKKYADVPNVLYEICNEPNGNITWAANVKPYAERIVGVIRANSPRGVILIGNPMWDQDVDIAAADPVSGTNLMYTLHFYAGTHHQALRDKAARALEMGAPIFVSEWGTSQADGSGGVYIDSSDEWLDFLDAHSISWCNWSLCNNGQTSAALNPGAPADGPWTNANLSESGRYVFSKFGAVQDRPVEPKPPVISPVTASSAAKQFQGEVQGTVRITRDGHELTGDDPVSTGCEIQLVSPAGHVEKSAWIVVIGDLTGSGTISLTDLVMMAGAMTGREHLEGLALRAAQFGNVDGDVELSDLVREAQLFSKGGQLTCVFEPQPS